MIKSILMVLALAALSQSAVPLPRSLDGRIIGGEDAELGEIPYQVSLQYFDGSHFCGGSVLNDNFVITAAHCVVGTPAGHFQIVAGFVDMRGAKSKYRVKEVIIHKAYDPENSWINDIALIRVSTPFVVSKTIAHATLPKPHQKIPANSVAVVSGWGYVSQWPTLDSPYILQRTEIAIAAELYCKSMYAAHSLHIHPTQICAFNVKIEAGSCNGDSGGPLTVGGQLVGLVSWGKGCASTAYPTVFTRVSEYIDWINDHAV